MSSLTHFKSLFTGCCKDQPALLDAFIKLEEEFDYLYGFAMGLTAKPDVSEINRPGNADVQFINYRENGKIYKRFKFISLKGEKGEKGDIGEVDYSNEEPLMDSSANPGTSNEVSRGDHVHPSDITKVDKTTFDELVARINKIDDYKYMFLKVHPVGSYYLTERQIDPNFEFGGTWERVENRFLIASDGSVGFPDTGNYPIGSEGGSDNQTLTAYQLPSHTHTISYAGAGSFYTNVIAGGSGLNQGASGIMSTNGSYQYQKAAGSGSTQTLNYLKVTLSEHTHSIGYTGTDDSFSILNPYRAIYIWRRTA